MGGETRILYYGTEINYDEIKKKTAMVQIKLKMKRTLEVPLPTLYQPTTVKSMKQTSVKPLVALHPPPRKTSIEPSGSINLALSDNPVRLCYPGSLSYRHIASHWECTGHPHSGIRPVGTGLVSNMFECV